MASFLSIRTLVAMTLFTFVISGCQSTNNTWATAWKDRAKPKSKFGGVDEHEEVTYWPKKPGKSKQKMTEMPDELKSSLAKSAEKSKNSTQLTELIKDGDQLRINNQFEDAKLVYVKALLISQDNPEVHHRLAIVCDKLRQFQEADQHYQAALRVKPNDASLLSDLGYSLTIRGNAIQAEATLKDALQINPRHYGAMANLGFLYSQQNRYQDALEMFRQGASESDSQRYMAQLFPNGQSSGHPTGVPNPFVEQNMMLTNSTSTARTNPTSSIPPSDLSKKTFDEIRQEMDRLAEEAKRRRQLEQQQEVARIKNLSSELERYEQEQQQRQQTAQFNPRSASSAGPMLFGPANGDRGSIANSTTGSSFSPNGQELAMAPNGQNSFQAGSPNNSAFQDRSPRSSAGNPPPTEIFRGTSSQAQVQRQYESQVQPARGQLSTGSYAGQQNGGVPTASQAAANWALAAGPGSMFPVMIDGAGMAPSTDGRGNQQASGLPNTAAIGSPSQLAINPATPNGMSDQLNGMPDTNDSRSQSDTTSSLKSWGTPSENWQSPSYNWQSPMSRAFNWQNGSSNQPGPSGDLQNTNGTVPANGAAGAAQSGWGQNAIRGPDSFGVNSSGNGPTADNRTNIQPTRPYNGAWPNSNSIPSQPQSYQGFNRSPESTEMMRINPRNADGNTSGNQLNSDGASYSPSSNSIQQYPYAPNR